MAQRQAVPSQLGFDVGAVGARLDARGTAHRVHFQHLAETLHVQRNGSGIVLPDRRFHTAANAAATTVGNHSHLAAHGPVQDVDHGLFIIRIGNPVWRPGDATQPHARAVGIALAIGVIEPVQWCIGEHGGKRRWRSDPRGGQIKIFHRWWRQRGKLAAQLLDHELDGGLFARGEHCIGGTPAPETARGAPGKTFACSVHGSI